MCYLSIKDALEQRAGVSCDKVDPTLQREEKIIWLEKTWFVDQKNPTATTTTTTALFSEFISSYLVTLISENICIFISEMFLRMFPTARAPSFFIYFLL